MRHFMIDVWFWTKQTHSKPLKVIRFDLNHFPTDKECKEIMYKDEEVKNYIDSEIGITYMNLREYNI